MDVLTLLIAIVALVVAILAFQRTGGINELRRQVDAMGSQTEEVTKSARAATADMLDRLEGLVRGKGKDDTPEEDPSPTTKEGDKS
jgi:hypothetical protein